MEDPTPADDSHPLPANDENPPTIESDGREPRIRDHSCLSYRQHAVHVMTLTTPIILSEFFQNTLPVIDIAFVGNLPSKEDLGAAALATVWFNLWNSTMTGFTAAIDTFLSQSFGASEMEAYGMWTATSIGVVMLVTLPLAGVVALCGPVMKLFGQDENLAVMAGEFSYRLIPGLFPYYAFKVLGKHLQAQNIVFPVVAIGILANGLNILFNWVLIFGLDMGLNGAPWATTLTRFLECILIVGYMFWNRKSPKLEPSFPVFSKQMWNRATLGPFCKLAISGALSMAAEAWSFEVTTILAGLLGTVELDAHIITLTIATFIFLSFPFAIGIAASIRVGQWLGDGKPADAKRSSVVSFLSAALVQMALIILLLPSNEWLGKIFSSNDEVADLVSKLIPISCVFMMGDAGQATVGGVMRGLGRQRVVLLLNILAFWILAIPVGSLLTFVGDAGVAGLWWGFVIGIYASMLVGLATLKFRISWEKETEKALKRLSIVSTLKSDLYTQRREGASSFEIQNV